MEEATILYEANGFSIMDTSSGLTFEFDDDDIKHGFTIDHESLHDPKIFADAAHSLVGWLG